MSRKVFLSFLGTSIYEPAFYIAEGQDEQSVEPTRFIQEAVVKQYCFGFEKEDKIVILTTQGALGNWLEDTHFDKRINENILYEGLKKRLRNLNLDCEIENIIIPDGKKASEIWDIFQIIFDAIVEKDQIIFDITHGFRTLPILNMVLINYAKLLRGISVSGIYYGNYEARYTKDGKTYSPIWNLIDFERLQEWTNSANLFLNTGNAIPLSKMITNEENIEIKTGLETFSKYILVNRGLSIVEGKEILKLRNALEQFELKGNNHSNKPLLPLLNRIRNEFDLYQGNHPVNGFLAVKWAIENGLIQQGATLLEEAVTTFILFEIEQESMIDNMEVRLSLSAALTIGDSIPFNYTEVPEANETETKENKQKRLQKEEVRKWQEEFVPVIRKLPYKKKLAQCVTKIKISIRNDMNHAGFRGNPRTYEELEASLHNRYNEIKVLLKSLNKMELPPLKK